MNRVMQHIRTAVNGLFVGAVVLSAVATAKAQTTPKYLITSTTALAVPSGFGSAAANTATDKYGNFYFSDEFKSVVYELPADGSAIRTVFTDKTGAAIGGVAIDSAGALYVPLIYHVSTTSDSGIYRLPPSSTGFQPYTFTGTAPATCTPGATTVCNYGAFYQTTGSNYDFGLSLTFDGSENGYFITTYDALTGGGKTIFACNSTCAVGSTNATIAVNNLPTKATSIAAAPNGDLYWADGKDVYYSKAGSGAYSIFETALEGFGGATGVGFDRAGNLYATSAYYTSDEYPTVKGLITETNKIQFTTSGSNAGPSVGNNGDVFVAPYGGATKISYFNANLGASAVGTAGTAVTLTVTDLSGGTIATVAPSSTTATASDYAVSGSTCTGAGGYAGATCTFNVTLTPTAVGLRRGTVVLTDTSGNTATAFLTGVGTGTGIAVDPGTPATITSTLAQPSGMALDAAKNVYVTSASGGTITRFPSGSTTGTAIATGLKTPTGVALDGAGNLLVVEHTGNDLLSFARSATSATGFASTGTVIASGLTSPTDVVVSGTGAIFVSNTGAQEVRQYPDTSILPTLAEYSSYGSSLGAPAGLALDSVGDLFIADTTNNQVVEISAVGVQSSIGSGLSAPTGVTVEASGSVIIADQGNGRLVRVPNETAGLTTNDQVALPQPLVNPYTVRVASDGTLFVSDNQANVLDSLSRTTGTVSFGITNVNSTSAAQSIIVSSTGTTALTLGNPFYAAVPASSNFTLSAGTVGTACAAGALNAGSTCSLSAAFKPTSTGTKSYTVPFNATATNTSSPSVILTGNGVQLVAVTVTVTQTPAGAVTYGTSVALTATVASAGTSTATPTGTLTFTVDGNASKGITLVNGKASQTLTGLSAGSHTVIASYGGDGTFASGSSTMFTVVVNPATTAGTLTITGTGVTPLSASVLDTVTFTTTITPAVAGNLTGTVTFYNGTTVLGTAAVAQTIPAGTAGYPTGQYAATYSFTPTVATPTPAGVYQVYAVFTPAANYSGFTTASQTLTIVAAPIYGIVADSYTITSSASQYGYANLTVSSYAGFQGGVSLTCSGLPANAYCIFRPAVVSLATVGTTIPPQTTQMQIRVDQNPVNIQSASGFGIAGAIVSLILFGLIRKKRNVGHLIGGTLALSVLSVTLSLMTACGSSSNAYPTPPGTYTVTLNSVATPLQGGQTPTLYSIARIQVAAGTGGNVAHIITYNTNTFGAGSTIQITGSSNAAFNGTYTLTGTSVDTTAGDPYLGQPQLDFTPATGVAVGTTATGGDLRQANVMVAAQVFKLIVQ